MIPNSKEIYAACKKQRSQHSASQSPLIDQASGGTHGGALVVLHSVKEERVCDSNLHIMHSLTSFNSQTQQFGVRHIPRGPTSDTIEQHLNMIFVHRVVRRKVPSACVTPEMPPDDGEHGRAV